MKRALMLLGFTAVAVGLLLAWRADWLSLVSTTNSRPHSRPVLHVATTTVKVQPMPILLQAVGQVETEHSVSLRPQVNGVLQKVLFTEGDEVKAGQLLFRIDPAPFAAQLASAKASLARDQAALDYAQAQARRLAPLAKLDYVTPQEYESAQTTAAQAKAALAVDAAAVRQARIELAYTEIRAPISGLTGNLNVKAGNLVSTTDTTPLVVINQIRPILVHFAIPQQQLDEVRQYRRAAPIKVAVTREDGSGSLGEGLLVFIDNAVNAQTGTVMLKARFANDSESLWPGQFVGIRATLTTQPHAVVVPASAVQVGQDGSYVFLVERGKSVLRKVDTDRQVGDLAVIRTGLRGGETVVTHVPSTLENGSTVIAEAKGGFETADRAGER
ncbi:MAG TPA: efflux RND transporter periplasmic adaptor subunit [Nitrococcus sp.]|nr:efflux RND transporter periplasmic adaptor subunit [Nitrococcus sp.]